MNKVILSLGSNLGHREQHLSDAIDALSSHDQIQITAVSSDYENSAVSNFSQPDFINKAIQITTFLTPDELLETTETIEKKLGRISKEHRDPRNIDIDIIFYNNDIISTDRLVIPHPLMHERLFVLDPVSEIAPEWIHPILEETVTSLKSQLDGY